MLENGWPSGVAALGGHDEGAVGERDAIAGGGGEEVPGGVLERLRSSFPACSRSCRGRLERTTMNWELRWMSWPGSDPLPLHWWVPGLPWVQTAATRISPVLRVHEDAGIGAAVFLLRFAAELAHVHDRDRVGPGAAAVGGAREADVDVLLEVAARVVAHVVDGEQASRRWRGRWRGCGRCGSRTVPACGSDRRCGEAGDLQGAVRSGTRRRRPATCRRRRSCGADRCRASRCRAAGAGGGRRGGRGSLPARRSAHHHRRWRRTAGRGYEARGSRGRPAASCRRGRYRGTSGRGAAPARGQGQGGDGVPRRQGPG